jgi:2-polyprenyl-6-methoxyphenol hydroxylase-like FAD-dependent oxidoreductase
MQDPSHPHPKHAIVIGGSLAGLFAGVLLRSIGWTVDIFERSPHDLDSRGGGIVLQPQVLQAFRQAGIRYDESIGVEARERVFLDRDGGIANRIPMRQMLTSWTSLYAAMHRHFSAEHYHQGAELTGFEIHESHVRTRFADGKEHTGELLIAADGSGSLVRRTLLPDVQADYAGYVAWRGLVDEVDLPDDAAAVLADRFAFFDYPNSHILDYLVPGEHDAVEPGRRRYNWVWYRNADEAHLAELLIDRNGRARTSSVPPGLLSSEAEADMRAAAERFLPPAFRQLVAATRGPFFQMIQDLAVPKMAFGRVALIGDAAFVPRPHTAASTSKAAGNALALVAALQRHTDVIQALEAWEPDQIEIGFDLRRQGKALGERSQAASPAPTPT